MRGQSILWGMTDSITPVIAGSPRPAVSVAHVCLLVLAQTGRATFRQIQQHPLVRSLGAVRSENSFYTALARMKRRRMIARTPKGEYELTASGEYAALKAYVRKECIKEELKSSSAAWDGKWRIVLFDVPEGKRPIRDYLRGVLRRQGFREFQRSMWVYPHRLPVFLKKLLADPQMRKYTRAITTYDIDYDEDLRRYFHLA
jgi:DNA-binding transcriptional regulator PaaX